MSSCGPHIACAFYQCVYHMQTECTTRMFHMSKIVKRYLSQNEVKFLELELYHLFSWPYCGHILRHDIEDLSDHGPAMCCAASAEGSAWSMTKFPLAWRMMGFYA